MTNLLFSVLSVIATEHPHSAWKQENVDHACSAHHGDFHASMPAQPPVYKFDDGGTRPNKLAKMRSFQSCLDCTIMIVFACCTNTTSQHCCFTQIGSKEVGIERLEQCGGEEANTPVRVNNVMINYERTAMKVDAQFDFNTSVDGRIKLEVELMRCRGRQESDSCEFHSRHRFTVQCRQLYEEGRMWTDVVKRIEKFPKQCPITPATYNVTGVSIELKNLKELPLGPGYWKVTGRGKMKNKQIFCTMAELDIQMQRSRKRPRSG